MHRRGSGLAVGSGRVLAIAFAVLLVGSVVTAPVVAAGLPGGGVASATDTGAAGAPSGLAASTSLAQTEQSTTPNESDVPTLGEYQPRDVDGDGRYEDVTGDGALGQSDISVFFEYQHRDVVKNHTEYFDYSGNGKVTHGDVAVLIDVVALDNRSLIDHRWPPDADRDGLPTAFEEDVAGTDPYDANSNSTLTAANESANDVGDAAEDLNGNGVTLRQAYEHGLKPLAKDTDGDGLPDAVELRYSEYNATVADTDEDGTLDGAEDLDGDTLDNADEVDAGTWIDDPDTDGDGLSDRKENAHDRFNPLFADTDNDGLDDWEESELLTHPNKSDTDGDGVPDGEETLESDVQSTPGGVTVSVRGTGYVADSVTVQRESALFDGVEAAAGPTVRVDRSTAIDDATIQIPIDDSVPESDHDGLAIYRWDGTVDDEWTALPTSIDSGEATVDTESLDYFTVLDQSEWNSTTEITETRGSKNDNRDFTADSDGDGLPDVLEKRTMQMTKGDGETFSTDPAVADTDGDGLSDGEEVELTSMEVSPDTGVYSIETHTNPTTADTDGDGLSDAEEAESWEIEVVDDHASAQTLVEQLADPETEVDVDAAFSTREVSSNPVLADSDGDGLSDGRERELLTDPRDTDTTGDGIDDAEALERDAEDPTVFSTTPPTVERLHYDQGVGVENYVPRYQFTYRYEISDPSGVKHYALRRGGIERDSETAPISLGENVTARTEFADELERLSSTLRGAQTTVLVRDRHGNEREVTLVSQSDLATKLAGDHAPRTAGTVAGVSHGVAELPDFANQLLRNHEALLEAVEAFAREASPELLVAMIANMPADVHRMQDEVNPSDSPPAEADGPGEAASICIEQGLDAGASESKYCRYATGFYLGYGAFTAVELASGAKALVKGVRKASDLATKIEDVAKNADSVRGALRRGGDSAAARISVGVSERIATAKNVGPRTVDRIVGVKETAGAKVRIARRAARFDGTDIGSLSLGEQEFVGRVLFWTSDDAARTLAADGGFDPIGRIYRLDRNDIDRDSLASSLSSHLDNGYTWEELDTISRDLKTLSEADGADVSDVQWIESDGNIDGVSRLARSLDTTDPSEIKGYVAETRYAAENPHRVVSIERHNSLSGQPGDFDVMTKESGDIINNEVKNWDFEEWTYDEFTEEMDGISGGMKNAIRSQYGDVGVDEYRIVFAKAPPTKYQRYLDDNGISYEIMDSVPQLQQ